MLAGDSHAGHHGRRPARHLVRLRAGHRRAGVRDRQGLGLPHQPGRDVRARGHQALPLARGPGLLGRAGRRRRARRARRSGRMFAQTGIDLGMGQTVVQRGHHDAGRSAIFAEGIGTFILMFAILGIVDTRSPERLRRPRHRRRRGRDHHDRRPAHGRLAQPGARLRARARLRDRRRRDALGPADPRLRPARPRRLRRSPLSPTTSWPTPRTRRAADQGGRHRPRTRRASIAAAEREGGEAA